MFNLTKWSASTGRKETSTLSVHCKKQALDQSTFSYLFQNINKFSTYSYLQNVQQIHFTVISLQLFVENDISFS